MKKSFVIILILLVSTLYVSAIVLAADFTATATIPTLIPVGLDPIVIQVANKGLETKDWTDDGTATGLPHIVTELNFDPMVLNPKASDSIAVKKAWGKNKAFLPDHFFSIDMGYIYGDASSEITQITISFAEGNNPNGSSGKHGIGWKSSAVFAKKTIDVTGNENLDVIVPSGTRSLLKTLATTPKVFTILTDIPEGWLRAYIGIATKDPADASTIPWPSDAEVFHPGDTPGKYTGTLTITSV